MNTKLVILQNPDADPMTLYLRLSITVLLSGLTLLVGHPSFSQSISRKEYIGKYRELAIEQMKKYNIPASITLAQACLESSDGNSRLAREGNNHFGIKCHEWEGAKIFEDDNEPDECFRKYPDVISSYEDHSRFLTERLRYRFLFSLPLTDYRGWADGLLKAGYATNPQYAKHLIRIIEEYNLSQYDTISQVVSPIPPSVIMEEPEKEAKESQYKIVIGRATKKINGVSCIFAGSRESYEDIAKEYNLFTKELLKFNDLKGEQPIAEGTVVFIERKKKENSGTEREYRVSDGETMYSISQLFGIRLKELLRMNPVITPGKEPVAGDLIRLKRR